MEKRVFSLLVDNQAGVLSRVSGLFSRRGYNIDSLTVGETEDPGYSRMTVVASGEPEDLEQIEKQLLKLEDVLDIKRLYPESSVTRELVLVKIQVGAEDRHKIIEIADIYRAKIVDVTDETIMLELTGASSKLGPFLKLLGSFKVLKIVRTGVAGLTRGLN